MSKGGDYEAALRLAVGVSFGLLASRNTEGQTPIEAATSKESLTNSLAFDILLELTPDSQEVGDLGVLLLTNSVTDTQERVDSTKARVTDVWNKVPDKVACKNKHLKAIAKILQPRFQTATQMEKEAAEELLKIMNITKGEIMSALGMCSVM